MDSASGSATNNVAIKDIKINGHSLQ